MNKIKTFQDFLEDKFMELREIGGMPIVKDNFESLSETWFENLEVQELIDFGQEYGEFIAKETVYNIVDDLQWKVNK